MVQFERELERKTELLAKCELCGGCVPDAKSCYINHAKLTFLCLQCYDDIPTLEECEVMVSKLRLHQKTWEERKVAYESFVSTAKEVNLSEKTPESVCLDALGIADVQGSG